MVDVAQVITKVKSIIKEKCGVVWEFIIEGPNQVWWIASRTPSWLCVNLLHIGELNYF